LTSTADSGGQDRRHGEDDVVRGQLGRRAGVEIDQPAILRVGTIDRRELPADPRHQVDDERTLVRRHRRVVGDTGRELARILDVALREVEQAVREQRIGEVAVAAHVRVQQLR
jgi:hypothetical protein